MAQERGSKLLSFQPPVNFHCKFYYFFCNSSFQAPVKVFFFRGLNITAHH